MDEGKALRENFPYAWADATNAKHLNFRMDNFMKFRLFDELQRPEVDLFIFHEHGLPTEQLINNEPPGISFESRYEVFRSSLYSYAKRLMKRNKLPADTAIAYLSEEYSVLPAFFDKLNDPEQMKKDSAIEADMYISTLDLARINTYPRAVILDACYNGSFHEDDYIAGYYIFNKGNTLVVSANSRNVLQDKWTMEFSGLLSYGVRFGNYFRLISTLEGHLMGDPTVRFAPGDKKSDYTNIFHQIKNKAGWKPLLKKDNPDIQCLALRSLTDLDVNQELSRDLLDIFKTSPYNVVRMEALKQLSRYNNQYFTNAITLALKDPYELIARQAAMYAGDQGDESLIAPMSEAFLYYPERKRVHYNLTSSFNQFPVKKVRTTVTSMLNTSDFMTKDSRKAEINDYFQSTEKQLENSLQKVKDKNLSPAKRISEIRMIRNYNYHYNTDTYLKILSDPQEDVRVRIALAEALGWFTHSYKKTDLIRTCKQLSAEDNLPAELRNELIQTINRLQ